MFRTLGFKIALSGAILGLIPSISAIPPPAIVSLKRLVQALRVGPPGDWNIKSFWQKRKNWTRPFYLSLLTSLGLFNFLGFFITTISSAETISAKIGMFFAFLALGAGSFFFAYSMKYYFTLALVLSFSRETESDSESDKQPGISLISGGFFGFLGKVFGIKIEVNQPANTSNPFLPGQKRSLVSRLSRLFFKNSGSLQKGLDLKPDLSKVTLER